MQDDKVKIDVRYIGCEDERWIELAQDCGLVELFQIT
jgi:hypothetical protein